MMGGFLEFVPGDSFLHRMNPVAKLACALLVSVACFCTGNLVFLVAVLVFDLVLAASCGMLRPALGLAKAVFFFSLILAVIQVLTTSTGAVVLPLPWGYVGTDGLMAALTTIVRLIAAAVPLFLVLYVTKLTDLSNAVVKVLRVPYRYAFTFTSTIHFIPVFMNDMKGIMEAQTARGVEFDAGGIVKKVRLMVPLCVPLLVSSVRKTNSSAIAAEVRGFNLRTVASGYKEYPFAGRDAAALAVCAALVASALALGIVW
ncbi:energy-coupling factor transporter transmembrane component T family protein [Paraeggerthella sp.]|uniref:energy-coupling factor transporter transmembrane component T family protein n=1 Tax=Paraeggerthella sp. TaxID=2897350 RepID=UPI003AB1AEDE